MLNKPDRYERWLKLVLRVAGFAMLPAIVALLMPKPWMAAVHSWLGLGEFPEAPIAEYLARQTSGMYALLGGAFVLAATDVRRNELLISYLVVALAALSIAMFFLCLGKLPTAAIAGDLVTATGFAAITLVLQRRLRRKSPPPL
ncbi:MAG TPA: hypothetical protein VM141_09510 [Planctomycetota bacterium]|nr:hypothetical protein [Planctomycetota bacterium]